MNEIIGEKLRHPAYATTNMDNYWSVDKRNMGLNKCIVFYKAIVIHLTTITEFKFGYCLATARTRIYIIPRIRKGEIVPDLARVLKALLGSHPLGKSLNEA